MDIEKEIPEEIRSLLRGSEILGILHRVGLWYMDANFRLKQRGFLDRNLARADKEYTEEKRKEAIEKIKRYLELSTYKDNEFLKSYLADLKKSDWSLLEEFEKFQDINEKYTGWEKEKITPSSIYNTEIKMR